MYGFKLQWESERDEERSVAASSLRYKQRIDSMFDDTRSVASVTSRLKRSHDPPRYSKSGSAISNLNIGSNLESKVTNEVQNRINMMFQEINKSEIDPIPEVENSKKIPVAYMGSIVLHDKITSLRQLQLPLKVLYLDNIGQRRTPHLVHGSLQITHNGLKVRKYKTDSNRSVETLYPFSSIAVWAAVKFVFRKKSENGIVISDKEQAEYAFMPLIADSESVDRISLFHNLSVAETELVMRKETLKNAPLFIVVTRDPGLLDIFDCHGFMCCSSNDAIALAANLYTSLVQFIPPLDKKCCEQFNRHSKAQPRVCPSHSIADNSGTAPNRPPCKTEIPQQDDLKKQFRNKKLLSDHKYCSDTRSDIVKNQGVSRINIKPDKEISVSLDDINCIEAVPAVGPFYGTKNSSNSLVNSSLSQQIQSSIRRSESDGGDILTKVAIPRSKSFLNASGPFFSRYTKGTEGSSNSASHKKSNIVSPLGLNELFQEFKQEGLYSMNEILDAIIDPDGMSFNDLKPIYKEFVLKLALTLTKDELYQRSKSIMQKQKHKKRQSDRRHKLKKSFISGNVLKKALKSSVTNLKYSKDNRNSLELTSVLFSSSRSDYIRKTSSVNSDKHLSMSILSSVANRERLLSRKEKNASSNRNCKTSRRSHDIKLSNFMYDRKVYESIVGRNERGKKLHNWSSGYISCSDCSYSSGSCARSSNENFYCSPKDEKSASEFKRDFDPDISSCECDTDSCFESDKCYCVLTSSSDKSIDGYDLVPLDDSSTRIKTGRQIGVPLETRRSTGNVSGTFRTAEANGSLKKDRRRFIKTGDTSSEYRTRSPVKLDSKIDVRIEKSSVRVSRFESKNEIKSNEQKNGKDVLMLSARDSSGSIIYKGRRRAIGDRSNRALTNTRQDTLCVKKTAEIAALFPCDNQAAIYNTLEAPGNFRESYIKTGYIETNLESSLGYLP